MYTCCNNHINFADRPVFLLVPSLDITFCSGASQQDVRLCRVSCTWIEEYSRQWLHSMHITSN